MAGGGLNFVKTQRAALFLSGNFIFLQKYYI